MAVRRPNFFIVGAPKCGTTALSEYLREHPQVCFSSPKEPNYFASDIRTRHEVKSEVDYLNCFCHATAQHKILAEGTVHNLQSRVAILRILDFSPGAKFLVIVRNPIELAHSWHSECRYNFGETEKSFERAWRLVEVRRTGRNVPWGCPDRKLLDYADVASLGSQLERISSLVAPENIKIMLFDDLKTNPKIFYEDVLLFLGLKSDGREFFPRINERKAVRYPAIMELSHLVAKAKRKLGIQTRLGILEQLNVRRTGYSEISEEFKRELILYFESEILKVEKLLKRDLSSWRQ